jgi:hypothetical protein
MNLTRRTLLGLPAALVPIHQAARREPPAGEGATGSSYEAATGPSRVLRPLTPGGTMYIGTYGDGIGIATYDAQGKIAGTGTIGGVPDPSFVIRDGNFLYAVDEQDAGAVTAIDISATPRVLNRQPNKGSGPATWPRSATTCSVRTTAPATSPCTRSTRMGASGNKLIWSSTRDPSRTRTRSCRPASTCSAST